MQLKDEENAPPAISAITTSDPVTGERVIREPIDEFGLILLETRIAADGTKRTRKVTRKGKPIHTEAEAAQTPIGYPHDPDL